ncbi:MAG TPA: FG-GAP-like repeat-containing protein, partial [Bradyrhizobium sp.]|nr:FG-GAP-like repeat-containing protein [Bradyrhizobium sp.]
MAQTSSLPGKFGVGATGAATYSVPIAAPPGTAGMSPSLSLDYNSQSGASSGWLGAGVVGVGWSLGGLPAIGRCPRTVTQDGVNGAVNYDGNDRFCLDGQRLIAVTGAYGADGTEYRTEIESFSRVISHGTAGTGQAWFEVRSKSGQILQFGNTTDSRILAQGKTSARSWGVNKVSDTKGNYFAVTYVNDTVNGQAYPSRIDYTANDAASLAAYNSVRFVYDSIRPDVLPVYHAGSLIKTTVRLTNVQTFAGSALVADYRLAYQQGSATGRSQLLTVTLCDGSGNCLPATTFDWKNGTTTPAVTGNVAGQNGAVAGSRPYLGDFNGDGLADIFWDDEILSPPSSTGTRVLWTATGGGNFAVTGNVAGQNGTLLGYSPFVGDFNRDGRSDIWWYQIASGGNGPPSQAGPMSEWQATGGSFAVSTGPFAPSDFALAGVFDITGDGRSDITWYKASTRSVGFWMMTAGGSITSSSATAPSGTPTNGPPVAQPATRPSGVDFNGDGRGDILWATPSSGMLALWVGNGDGTFTQIAGADTSVTGYSPYFADLNGDGKTDVLWDLIDGSGRSTGQRILWISRGDGTFVVSANAGGLNGSLSGYAPNFGDFNGDGVADVLWNQVDTNGLSTGARVAWLGKGDGTFTVVSNYGGQDGTLVGYVPLLADFNGDGKTDVMWDSRSGTDTRSTGARVLWLSDGVVPDVLAGVTTGVGTVNSIVYKSLTDGTVYTKDSNAVDPIIDVQMPLQVVSRSNASNGIGGTLATDYVYAGAKMHLDGRGFLGFRQTKATDAQTGIVQTSNFRQDYPYLNLAASETQTVGGITLGATTNTHGSTALGGTRYQVFLTQSQTAKNDLDGTAFPTATASYQYDAYNNATQVVAATSDGYSKTTNNTYTNDATNWILGRLTGSTVTAQAPQQLGQYCSLPWGGTIGNGQSVTAYSASSAPVGQACSTIAQTRTCNNGA